MLIVTVALLGKLVALRKESVDRNNDTTRKNKNQLGSLSVRRAWIEIHLMYQIGNHSQSRSP